MDSQTTIDSMHKMWTDTKARHRHYKDIANYSIFHTINQIRTDKLRANSHVYTHKVAAHQSRYDGMDWTDIENVGDRLNARADDLAKAGREAEVGCAEAWHNCARATLQSSGQLEESSSYGTVYARVDAAILAHIRTLKNNSPRLQVYDREGIWERASCRNADLRDPVNLFAFSLLFRTLHTPRNIQVTNPHIPLIYHDYKCPLCYRGRGHEFHVLCKCTKLLGPRTDAFLHFVDKMSELMGAHITEELSGRLSRELFPNVQDAFKYGEVPLGVKAVIVEWIGEEGANAIGKKVGSLIRKMYHAIWKAYGTMIGDKHLTFADRLMNAYNMTVSQLTKRAPALKLEYRNKVRAERARRAAEARPADEEVRENAELEVHGDVMWHNGVYDVLGMDDAEIQMDGDMDLEAHAADTQDTTAPDD